MVYDFPEKNLIFMNFNKMLSLLNWLSLVSLNIGKSTYETVTVNSWFMSGVNRNMVTNPAP